MLIIFKTVFLLLMINFGNGILIDKIFSTKIKNFVMLSFLGMMSITFLEVIIAFFYPLDFASELLFLLFGLVGLLVFITEKDFSMFSFRKNTSFWFYFFLITVVFAGSFSPYFFDHYSYYVPTVGYLREFGFIKGISNLDLLFGQSSFWHVFQAGFSNFVDVGLRINSYLLILFLVYIFESKRWVLLLFFPFFLIFLQQPSPDLPVFIFSLIILNEMIDGRNSSFILCLSLFAFCIKPTAFWLPLLAIIESLYTRNFKIGSLFPIVIVGILFTIKNIWLFGYPVFPVSAIDMGISWTPDKSIMKYSSQMGMMKSYDMKYTYQQISDFDFWQKLYYWFRIGFKSVFNVGIVLCLVILGYFALRKKDRIYAFILVSVLLKFILIIIFSAQYRFFIDLYLVTVFLIFKNASEERVVFVSVFLSVLVSVLFTFPGFVKDRFHMGKWMTGFHFMQLINPTESEEGNLITYQLGNLKFNAAKDLIYKAPVPTLSLYWLETYHYYGVFPQVSGNGFVQRKLSPAEKKQLETIIRDLKKSRPEIP